MKNWNSNRNRKTPRSKPCKQKQLKWIHLKRGSMNWNKQCNRSPKRNEAFMKKFILIFGLLIPTIGFTQSYSINWYKVAGGGGTSSGGNYSISGTIGQPDAGGAMTGGGYSLTGGFWSLIAVVQSAGLPNLTIMHSGNTVIISWPDTGSYT